MQGGGRAEEGVAGPHGRFLGGTLRMLMCERDLRSRVNWMMTAGQEERKSPNLFEFPIDTVILTPVLIWDVRYGSGMEKFGPRAEVQLRVSRGHQKRLLTFLEKNFCCLACAF